MILVDACVWIDHFRARDAALAELLDNAQVLAHPWVTGELTLGGLAQRDEVVMLMNDLPQAVVATDDEVYS